MAHNNKCRYSSSNNKTVNYYQEVNNDKWPTIQIDLLSKCSSSNTYNNRWCLIKWEMLTHKLRKSIISFIITIDNLVWYKKDLALFKNSQMSLENWKIFILKQMCTRIHYKPQFRKTKRLQLNLKLILLLNPSYVSMLVLQNVKMQIMFLRCKCLNLY